MKATIRLRDFRRIMPRTSKAEFGRLLAWEATRQSVRATQGGLLSRVSAILYQHDPEGPDENQWQTEAASLISRGLRGRSIVDIRRLVTAELAGCPGYAGDFGKIAKQLARLF